MTAQERLYLFHQAQIASHLGFAVEVGSYLGASAVLLAEAARRSQIAAAKVYCIDTWRNDAMTEGRRDTFEEFKKNVFRWSNFIVPVMEDSRTAKVPSPGSCDLLFVDGDHSYDMTANDLRRFSPCVRPGGALLMHDYTPARERVVRSATELIAKGDWLITGRVNTLLCLQRQLQPHGQ